MANETVLQPCTNIVPAVLHVPMESSSQSVMVPKDSITMLHPCAKVDMHMGATISASTVHMRLPVTPKYKSSSSLTCSSFIPECQESLKHVVGMSFDSVDDVEKFYKSYAHESGFSIRIGQHKKENEEILIKRYYCSREGYRGEKDTRVIDQSKKKEEDT